MSFKYLFIIETILFDIQFTYKRKRNEVDMGAITVQTVIKIH